MASVLSAHNSYRNRHCVPALAWSPRLAAGAQQWADRCTFAHSPGAWKGRDSYGENLAWGTSLSGRQAVDMWYREKSLYNFSAPVWNRGFAHFTQAVWRSSKELGCGVAQCQGKTFWVCRYFPPGNFNVFAPEQLSRNVPGPCR